MADGRTHLKVALIADAALVYMSYQLMELGNIEGATGILMGAALGTLITPDYDLNGSSITENMIRKILPVLGDFWVADWYLYALWNKHRGWSHIAILGTVVRAVYLAWRCWWWYVFLAGLLHLYFSSHLGLLEIGASLSPTAFWYMFIVWCIHDGLHIIFDIKGKKRNVNYKRYTSKN